MAANPSAVAPAWPGAIDRLFPGLERLLVVNDVILHWPSRLLVWPSKGVIYGRLGTQVGTVSADGYVRVNNPRGGCLYGHRLVWEAVHGPIPHGLQIDHLNGRKADNRLVNLDAVTRCENMRRAIAMGQAPTGERCATAKLTAELVCEIRASETPASVLAERLDVHPRTIRDARRGATWRHVSCRGRRVVRRAPGRSRRSRG